MDALQELIELPIASLDQAIADYRAAYGAFLIAEAHADKFRWVPHGLSIWFPPTENKYYLWDQGMPPPVFGQTFFYEDPAIGLEFVTDASWLSFLMEYYVACGAM